MVTIGTLNGGNITITTGGSTPVTRAETRFWWSNDDSVYDEELISLLDDAVFYNFEEDDETKRKYNLRKIEIGSGVTEIAEGIFNNFSNLTTIIILGKTTAEAQTLLANAGVPAGCTIVGELG